MDVAVVSGTDVGNIDGQLPARPSGAGRLFLGLNRGSELFIVDRHGPRLLYRRQASPAESAALDAAAAAVVERLAVHGLQTALVSVRLNRRKIDLIPLPEWADPAKARIAELLEAVTRRLNATGITGLAAVVVMAAALSREAGLADPRITSDVKHVEIGLTDKSDSMHQLMSELETRGIGAESTLIVGDEFGPVGGVAGSDSMLLIPQASKATVVSVGVEPNGVPEHVEHRPGGPIAFLALLDEQLLAKHESLATGPG